MWEMLLLAGLSGGAAPVPAVDATKPPLVSPKRLIEMFLMNEAFADERYSGKVIHVRGKVARISRYPSSDLYRLYLDPEGAGKDPAEPTILKILFSMEQRKALAGLNPGDVVTVSGRCGGRELYSQQEVAKGTWKLEYVIRLADCVLLPKEKPAPATPAPKEP